MKTIHLVLFSFVLLLAGCATSPKVAPRLAVAPSAFPPMPVPPPSKLFSGIRTNNNTTLEDAARSARRKNQLERSLVKDAGPSMFHGGAMFKNVFTTNGSWVAWPSDWVHAVITVMNLCDFGDSFTITRIYDTEVHRFSTFTNNSVSDNFLGSPVNVLSYMVSSNNTYTVEFDYQVLPADQYLPDGWLADMAMAFGTDNHDGLGASHIPQGFTFSYPNAVLAAPMTPEIRRISVSEDVTTLSFPVRPNYHYDLLSAPSLPAVWSTAASFVGDGTLKTIKLTNAPAAMRFYQLRAQ